jgi:mannose-6-phosphate isomerase-like protein (cupin superfamily)
MSANTARSAVHPTKSTVLLPPGDGEAVIWPQGDQMLIKASAEHTAGTLAVVEYTMPPGTPAPPFHVHPETDEAWFVLAGELTMDLGSQQLTIGPGGFAFVPGHVPHTFSNEFAAPLRFLLICTPGGFEGFFREMAVLTASGQPDFPAILAVAARYGAHLAPQVGG